MAVTTEELLAAAARAAAGDDFDTLYALDTELLHREAAGLTAVTDEELIERAATGRLPGLDSATDAVAGDRGPFEIVTGSGERIPESSVFGDRAAAEVALGIANRRAARLGRSPAYRIVPARTRT